MNELDGLLPEDPMSEFDEWSAGVHEWMESMIRVGFTPEQAFQVLLRGVSRGWFDGEDDE